MAADGSVYGVEGNPSGGRVVRIAPDGSVSASRAPARSANTATGRRSSSAILPSGVALAADGDVLFTQVEPVPALRRLDTATGLVTTLARGR